MHSHPAIEIVYHPQGSGVTSLEDGRSINFRSNGTVIYPAHLRHSQRMLTPGIEICIHASPGNSGNDLFSEPLHIPAGASDCRRADRYVRSEFLHLSQIPADPRRQVEIDLRVTALVARLLQMHGTSADEIPKTIPEIHVARARQFIAENYERIGSSGEIARHIGVSEDYLRHIILEQGGPSLTRSLNQTRIERVKELLIQSQLPIKQIAAMTGFKTERYLSTRFKQFSGSSPGSFRRKAESARTSSQNLPRKT